MLHELHIAGLGVIDDLDLALHPGLNVLTGETGAGKTMVTVGLTLALGARASASLVRDGAEAARVQARFDASRRAADDWAEDGEVILARTVSAEGKGTARICGPARHRVHAGHRSASTSSRCTVSIRRSACLTTGDADGVPRPVRRRRAPRGAGRVPRGVRRAARRPRTSSTACARRRATASANSTCSPTRCARSRRRSPSRARARRSAAEETRLAHVERLLEHTAAAGSRARRRRWRRRRCRLRGRASAQRRPPSSIRARESSRRACAADWRRRSAELARDVRDYREVARRRPRAAAAGPGAHGRPCRYCSASTARPTRMSSPSWHEASERLVPARAAPTNASPSSRHEVERRQDEVERAGRGGHRRPRPRRRVTSPMRSRRELQDLGMPGAVVQVALRAADAPGPGGVRARGAPVRGRSRSNPGPAGQDGVGRRAVANDAGVPQRAGRPR